MNIKRRLARAVSDTAGDATVSIFQTLIEDASAIIRGKLYCRVAIP